MDAKSQIVEYNAKLDELKQEKYQIQDNILELARNKEYAELAELIVEYPDWVKTGELAIILGCKHGKALEFIMELSGWTIRTYCKQCGNEILVKITSKDQIKQANRKSKMHEICEDCRNNWASKSKERETAEIKRLHELKTMPYREYLKTEHWQDTRLRALKASNFRCQLCNSGNKSLEVHHRTYERRGQEYIKDLIVLCEDCHGKFHDKLPEES